MKEGVRSLREMASYKAEMDWITMQLKTAYDKGSPSRLTYWTAKRKHLEKWHKVRRYVLSPELPWLKDIQGQGSDLIFIDDLVVGIHLPSEVLALMNDRAKVKAVAILDEARAREDE